MQKIFIMIIKSIERLMTKNIHTCESYVQLRYIPSSCPNDINIDIIMSLADYHSEKQRNDEDDLSLYRFPLNRRDNDSGKWESAELSHKFRKKEVNANFIIS